MAYKSLQEIEERCRAEGISFSEAVLLDDLNERGVSREDSRTTMHGMWKAMKEASDGYDAALRSNSGLVGGAGGKMREYVEKEEPLSGGFVGKVISSALEMGESNACMKRIVAAPTAGACGVLPAVLVTYYREYGIPEEKMIEAMYVAAGIGQIIANRAYLAGASGGCQAEIGSGSGMAAAAICYIKGGTMEQLGHACAMALKNLMGLVCDPVGGLVEVPCVKRNVGGAVNALAAADSVIIPVQAHYLPAKGMTQLMRTIGKVKRQINPSLKVDGVLLTLVDGRTNLAKQTAETLRQSYGSVLKIYRSEIPVAIKAAEISAAGKSIYAYDNGSKVAQAYAEFSKEVQADGEKQRAKLQVCPQSMTSFPPRKAVQRPDWRKSST